MERAAQVEGEEVRHVHQRVDRAQADAGEAALQPVRAGAVADAADGPAEYPGAGLRHGVGPGNRAEERARDRLRRPGAKRAQPGRRQVPRDAADRERIAAVGGDADLDDRVVQPGPGGIGHAHRGTVRQVHDAGMVLAQAHLPGGEQHPGALHSADFAGLERDPRPGDMAARRREHRFHTRPRVRGAAHHAHDAVPGVHLADSQPVRVGVLHGFDDMRHAEGGQGGAGVRDLFQLQPDAGQPVGDRVQRSVRVQVGAQPAQGELHAPAPSCRDTGASGLNP